MNSFPKERRLLAKYQFDRVFEKPKRVFFPEFLILFRKKEKAGEARIGLAISKKSVNKSTNRNRCKRLVRESFRLTLLPDVDIIFLSRRGLDNLSNAELNNKLASAWLKLKHSLKK